MTTQQLNTAKNRVRAVGGREIMFKLFQNHARAACTFRGERLGSQEASLSTALFDLEVQILLKRIYKGENHANT